MALIEYRTLLKRASYTDIGAAPDIIRIDWPPADVQVDHCNSVEASGFPQLPETQLMSL